MEPSNSAYFSFGLHHSLSPLNLRKQTTFAMHDYQLERLNTRSFEQLVQALGLEIIGKQLMIFGDGPDGGREATFEGSVKYPEGKQQWNGYGMVQAKFRQIPDSLAKKNADWAIAQLNSEFKKLKPRLKGKSGSDQGKRICPEYYVFATNLSLSPVLESGGKDRVRAVLDGFKKTHGLKDYAIWDGDQIRRFVDAHPGIRTTYLAWLLPGDVLTEVMKHLELDRTDFQSTIRRYLESELLDDQFAKLGQGGYTDANAIPLSNVFVDLPITLSDGGASHQRQHVQNETLTEELDTLGQERGDEQRPTFLGLFLEEGRQVLKPSANSVQNRQTHKTAGRVVLIGGPGQGKTTVGLFTCQLLRAALLRACGTAYSPEITQALAIIAQQSQELPKTDVLRYPLRVDLKKLAEALAGKGDFAANSLLDYLVRHISKRTDSDLSKSDFRVWLKSYPWLLVLDGLDEVPASSNRTKMMDAIRDFVSVEAYQQDADLLVLATTRPQGYSDEFDPALYRHLPLAPLNAVEALKYGSKLAAARHSGLKTRVEELVSSLNRATTNPATVRLMESPLQVTIMLALIEGGGEPPEQRWKLFHDYYDVIYRREKERGTPFSTILGSYEPEIHWLHHRAGWLLQQRNAGTGATAARLTHAEFEKLVNERLIKRGHKDIAKRNSLVHQIREAATDRLVFLVGNTANEIGFEIRSLQEFMAAEHCFDGSESSVQETLRAIAPHPYWRNVFLFIAGRIFFEKESLIDSLVAVCERLNEPLSDRAQGFIAAGSRLALAMLKDGAARNQPENSRVLARCACRLLNSQNLEEASELIEVFSGEACEVWEEELTTKLQNRNDYFPHFAWRLCLELVSTGDKQATQIMLNQFPWRNIEIGKFLCTTMKRGRLVPDAFWIIFKEYVFYHPPSIWHLLCRGMHGEESYPLVLLEQQNLHHIFVDKIRSEVSKVILINDSDIPTGNAVTLPSLDNWSELRLESSTLKVAHPEWQTYHAISEFCRNSTPENLARQLALVFANDPSCGSANYSNFPWQFHACIVAKESGMAEAEIISAVSSSALGNTEDWVRWSNPNKNQIRLSFLGFQDGILSATDSHQGPIFGNSGWSHSHGVENSDFKFAKTLTAALPNLAPQSHITQLLVYLCCFGLNSANSNWEPNDFIAVKNYIACCQNLNIPMTREIVAAVVRSSLETIMKMELLAAIGTRINKQSWLNNWEEQVTQVNESCKEIVAALNDYPGKNDVLGALSFLPPLSFVTEIPESSLSFELQKNDTYKQVSIVFKSNSLIWNLEDADALAFDTLSLRKQYPYHLGELLEFMDAKGANGAHLEAFLLALTKKLSLKSDSSFLSQISSLLVKLVERRPAINSLPDPAAPKSSNS